jgi:Icc-related predicted phosphoesterase
MIIDCISDLHGFKPLLEGGDVLIVAGDLTAKHSFKEFCDFFEWFESQKYTLKILIAGNHDRLIETGEFHVKAWLNDNTQYLDDSGTEIESVTKCNRLKVWGSPWSLWFDGINPRCKSFTCKESELEKIYAKIPDDVDILITHQPPFGILDGLDGVDGSDFHVGSHSLLAELENRIKPKLHVFGHIHEKGGQKLIFKRPGYGDENNTICINASVVNEKYKHVNKPMRVIL